MKKFLTGSWNVRSASTCSRLQQVPKPFEEISGPKPLPLIGNVWRYLPLVGDYQIDQLYENAQFNRKVYGPIVREQITPKHTVLHLFDPDDIEEFFRNDGKEPHRRSHRALLKYRRDRPNFYNDGGLFPENGPRWSRLRKTFQKYMMRRTEISKRTSILDAVAQDSIKSLNGSKLLENFETFLYEWSLKSSLAIFLDFDPDEMPGQKTLSPLIESLHNELEAIDGTEIKSERWSTEPNKCPFFGKLSRSESMMYDFVNGRLNSLVETDFKRRKTSFVRDWISNDDLDRKDVTTFILDSILAGLHTTAYTTTFLLYHISRLNVSKLDELQRQVDDCMRPYGELSPTGVFDGMAQLKDCIKETLRMNPVSIGTGRLTQTDMVIRNYHVPKDVMVVAHNQAICRDPMIYERPDEFLPERWANNRKRPKDGGVSAFSWLPYGFGPRACIGQRLVNLQILVFAARFLQNYNWKFEADIKTRAMLVHVLEGNIRVNLVERIQDHRS